MKTNTVGFCFQKREICCGNRTDGLWARCRSWTVGNLERQHRWRRECGREGGIDHWLGWGQGVGKPWGKQIVKRKSYFFMKENISL